MPTDSPILPLPADPSESFQARSNTLPGWLLASLQMMITLILPAILVLTGIRLVTTGLYLELEYRRPGFPADRFGFTQQDRLRYAPYAIRYLLNDSDISYLGDLRLGGEPMFTERELSHMEDVKTVTRAAFTVHLVLLALLIVVGLLAVRYQNVRQVFWRGLFAGGTLTISLIITLIVLILANWDYFFTGFHTVFFEGDSWLFSTSDTLIRLFPQQFWFDTAVTIGVLTVIGALIAMLLGYKLNRRPRS